MDPAALLAGLVRGYFFGFVMPARLAGREMWASLVLNAVQVVFQFVVPAMLARSNPGQVFREALHAERHLLPEQRRKVRELVAAVGEMAAGIAGGPGVPRRGAGPDGMMVPPCHHAPRSPSIPHSTAERRSGRANLVSRSRSTCAG